MPKDGSKFIRPLISYYGLLQSLHLLTLIRAGVLLMWGGNNSPFPILPPASGWQSQTLPFMFGLAFTDTIGILLGIGFAYLALFKGKFIRRLGTLSLTIFITGAIVFAAGTYPTGAWAEHPVAYWGMAILFTPSILLYLFMLQNKSPLPNQHEKE